MISPGRAREADEVLHGARGQRRVHRENAGRVRKPRHRLEITQHVVGQLAVEALVDGVRPRAAHREGIAVRRRTRNNLAADDAARPAPVLHDHLLAERATERAGDDPCGEIDETARRESHDHPHRLEWIGFCRDGVTAGPDARRDSENPPCIFHRTASRASRRLNASSSRSVTRRQFINSSRVASWQLTPGTSSIQPIHHLPDFFTTAV